MTWNLTTALKSIPCARTGRGWPCRCPWWHRPHPGRGRPRSLACRRRRPSSGWGWSCTWMGVGFPVVSWDFTPAAYNFSSEHTRIMVYNGHLITANPTLTLLDFYQLAPCAMLVMGSSLSSYQSAHRDVLRQERHASICNWCLWVELWSHIWAPRSSETVGGLFKF